MNATVYLPLFASIYSICLVLSNITSTKLVSLSSLTIDGGFIFFPITYVINDVVTEVYGYKTSKQIIWIGFLAAAISAFGIWLVKILPASPEWHNQNEFATTFALSGRIFAASMISYLAGEFINAIALTKLKAVTKGKYIAARFILSSILGAAIENSAFYFLAFYDTVPLSVLLQMMVLQYVLKLIYEIMLLPISCFLAIKLKSLQNDTQL